MFILICFFILFILLIMCVLLLFSQDPTDIVSIQCADYQILISFVSVSQRTLFCLIDIAKLRRILPHSNKFLVFHSKSIRQLPLFYDCRFLPLKICRTKGSAPFIGCAAFVVLEILPTPLSACDAWLVQVVSKSHKIHLLFGARSASAEALKKTRGASFLRLPLLRFLESYTCGIRT